MILLIQNDITLLKLLHEKSEEIDSIMIGHEIL